MWMFTCLKLLHLLAKVYHVFGSLNVTSIFLDLLRWPGAILCYSLAVVKSSGSEEAWCMIHRAQMDPYGPCAKLEDTLHMKIAILYYIYIHTYNHYLIYMQQLHMNITILTIILTIDT